MKAGDRKALLHTSGEKLFLRQEHMSGSFSPPPSDNTTDHSVFTNSIE